MSKVYLSGPMTGYPQFNYPAFNRIAESLTRIGFKVVNPVEICSHLPQGSPWSDFMDVCLPAVAGSKKIYLLKGWEKSKGARLELKEAIKHELEIVQQGDFLSMP